MDRIRRTLARLLTTWAGRLWPADTPVEARIRGLSAQPETDGGRSERRECCGTLWSQQHQPGCRIAMDRAGMFPPPEQPPATDGGRSEACTCKEAQSNQWTWLYGRDKVPEKHWIECPLVQATLPEKPHRLSRVTSLERLTPRDANRLREWRTP